MNLMSSTLVFDDASGDPFHLVQARHIHAFREAGERLAMSATHASLLRRASLPS